MNISLSIISDLYKKTAIVILIFSFLSFIILKFFLNFFYSISFSIGCFILFLNVLGIFLISCFAKGKENNIGKEKIIFSTILFFGKLFLIIAIIFLLLKFHLVDSKYFLGGLSLGFAIFFISNLIFLPIKIYKQEN